MLNRTFTFTIANNQPAVGLYWQVLHVLVMAACWLNGLESIYRAGLMLGVLISWQRSRRLTAQKSGCSYLRYTGRKHWALSRNGDSFCPVSVDSATYLSPWLIILHYRPQNTGQLKKGTLLIARQTLAQDEFRRLRVMLKLSGNDRN